MNSAFFKRHQWVALFAGLGAGLSSVASAQSMITPDGSTGKSQLPVLPTSGKIEIDGETYGTKAKSNLFFSFSNFDVGQGDTASFIYSSGNINNVISRVTGLNASTIAGKVEMGGGLANSNFWFFNPKGVVLGSGANFDVGGALHISTASQLQFGTGKDETFFDADINDKKFPNVEPFGFSFAKGGNGEITMQGVTFNVDGNLDVSANNIIVDSGINTFSVDGDVTLAASQNITVGNSGEIIIGSTSDNAAIKAGEELTVNTGGKITANNGDFTLAADSHLTVDNGVINAQNDGNTVIQAGGILTVKNGGSISRSVGTGTLTVTSGEGLSVSGGNSTILVESGSTATIDGGNGLVVSDGGEISSADTHTGNISVKSSDGDIKINTQGRLTFANAGEANVAASNDLTVQGGGGIEKTGGGGDFNVTAENLLKVAGTDAKIRATGGSGNAIIDGQKGLDVSDNGEISSANTHTGNITAKSSDGNIDVNTQGKLAFANTGEATVEASNDLTVQSGGGIERTGGGDGFNVTAGNRLKVSGTDAKIRAAGGSGNAIIDGQKGLEVSGNGEIGSANTHTGNITVKSSDGNIDVNTGGKLAFANAGEANVAAGNDMIVQGGSIIEKTGGGGDFNVTAGNLLKVAGTDAKIRATGGSGNAIIDGKKGLEASDNGEISSANTHTGNITAKSSDGNIDVNTGGQLAFANAGDANVAAGSDLTVQGGSITAANTVTAFNVSAGGSLKAENQGAIAANNNGGFEVKTTNGDLTVDNGSITANNGANTAVIHAGKDLKVQNGGTLNFNNAGTAAANAGQDLLVAGAASITADKTVTDFEARAGRNLSVSGANSRINANNIGPATVKSSGGNIDVNTGGKLAFANAGDANVAAGSDLTVQGASITAANTVTAFNVSAGGSLKAENQGAIEANNNGGFEVKTTNGDLTVDNGSITANNGANTAVIHAGKDLKVQNGGTLNFSNAGMAAANAEQDLLVASAASITADKTVTDFEASAGRHLSVSGANSRINANNMGSFGASAGGNGDLTVNMGNITANNGGNSIIHAGGIFTVDNGGLIKRPAGSGAFEASAGNTLKVTGADSKILVEGGGDATIDGATRLEVANGGEIAGSGTHTGNISVKSSNGDIDINTQGKLAFANAGTATVQAGNDLTVQSGGGIERTGGSGDFNAVAGNLLKVAATDSKIRATGGSGNVTIDGQTGLEVSDSGEISSASEHSGNITVKSSNGDIGIKAKGVLDFNNTGMVAIDAGQDLLASGASHLSAGSSVTDFDIKAGRHLSVVGSDSNITANNSGSFSATAGAGLAESDHGPIAASNNGAVNVASANGDLTVDAGLITANNQGKATLNAGQRFSVIKAGEIVANNAGEFEMNANAHADYGWNKTDKSTYAFQVSGKSKITKNNIGNMSVKADTVYLDGSQSYTSVIVGQSPGEMIFDSNKGDNRYFAMNNAVIENQTGKIKIINYNLKLKNFGTVSRKAGIDITTPGNNPDLFDPNKTLPTSIPGINPAEAIRRVYFATPNGISTTVNGKPLDQKNLADSLLVRQLASTVVKKNNLSFSKKPCDSQHGASTLDYRTTSGFVAKADSQMPYSIVSAVARNQASVGVADTESGQITMPDNKIEGCQ